MFQSIKAVTIVCAICSPVPLPTVGTVGSFSTLLPVTSIQSQSIWPLPVTTGSSFPSKCTLSGLVSLKFSFICDANLRQHDSASQTRRRVSLEVEHCCAALSITVVIKSEHVVRYTIQLETCTRHQWGMGGALAESTPFVRRVMGSTPALATM